MNLYSIVSDILRREGGFVNHQADRGGPTNFGITQAVLSAWRKQPVTLDDVKKMTQAEARAIYHHDYITAPRFDQIKNPALQALVIDCGVNHGVNRATRWLQEAVATKSDGVIGPITLAAINRAVPEMAYKRVLAQRCLFYGQIISRDPTQAVFASGWMARLADFIIT